MQGLYLEYVLSEYFVPLIRQSKTKLTLFMKLNQITTNVLHPCKKETVGYQSHRLKCDHQAWKLASTEEYM